MKRVSSPGGARRPVDMTEYTRRLMEGVQRDHPATTLALFEMGATITLAWKHKKARHDVMVKFPSVMWGKRRMFVRAYDPNLGRFKKESHAHPVEGEAFAPVIQRIEVHSKEIPYGDYELSSRGFWSVSMSAYDWIGRNCSVLASFGHHLDARVIAFDRSDLSDSMHTTRRERKEPPLSDEGPTRNDWLQAAYGYLKAHDLFKALFMSAGGARFAKESLIPEALGELRAGAFRFLERAALERASPEERRALGAAEQADRDAQRPGVERLYDASLTKIEKEEVRGLKALTLKMEDVSVPYAEIEAGMIALQARANLERKRAIAEHPPSRSEQVMAGIFDRLFGGHELAVLSARLNTEERLKRARNR
jgi:hypothetical protein